MQRSKRGRVLRATAWAFLPLLCVAPFARAEAQQHNAGEPSALTAGVDSARSMVPDSVLPPSRERTIRGKVTPSFSIAPKVIFRRRGARGAMFDYAKQTVWLSTNVHDLLPQRAKPLWPSALRVSVGRRGLGAGLPAEYAVGLDVDASRLPGSHPVWMQAKAVLHMLRLPGPALVVTPSGNRFVGLYW